MAQAHERNKYLAFLQAKCSERNIKKIIKQRTQKRNLLHIRTDEYNTQTRSKRKIL